MPSLRVASLIVWVLIEAPDVVDVSGDVNPQRDIEIIDTELILADLESVEKRIEKTPEKPGLD